MDDKQIEILLHDLGRKYQDDSFRKAGDRVSELLKLEKNLINTDRDLYYKLLKN